MNKKVLENIRNTYEILKRRKKQIISDLEKLNNGEISKESEDYYRIIEETSGIYQKILMNSTDDELLARACYLNFNKDVEPSKIYLYLGTYMFSVENSGIRTIKLRYDEKNADYRWYKDIENYEDKLILIPFSQDFESKEKIVYTNVAARPTIQNDIFEKLYYYEVYKVQHDFVKLAIEKGTKEATKEILEKYSKEKIAYF